MTEEVKQPEGEKTPDTQEQNPQVSAHEAKALEMGWRPREEFDGDDEDFIDAKEFVRRKPLFDKIETQSKKLKDLGKAVEALKQHYTEREAGAVKAALARLQEAQEEAISNADGATYTKVSKEIKRLEKEANDIEQVNNQVTQGTVEVNPEFQDWMTRNRWYSETQYMRAWADDYGVQLHKKENLTPAQVLKKVEEAVKKEFPHKFTNSRKSDAPDVESSSRNGGGKGKEGIELTDQQRKIMNALVSTKTMTKEEYLAGIKLMQGKK